MKITSTYCYFESNLHNFHDAKYFFHRQKKKFNDSNESPSIEIYIYIYHIYPFCRDFLEPSPRYPRIVRYQNIDRDSFRRYDTFDTDIETREVVVHGDFIGVPLDREPADLINDSKRSLFLFLFFFFPRYLSFEISGRTSIW